MTKQTIVTSKPPSQQNIDDGGIAAHRFSKGEDPWHGISIQIGGSKTQLAEVTKLPLIQ